MSLPEAPSRSPIPTPGTLTQRLRMVTGLILFGFLAAHLGNHALGLIDIDTMQGARSLRLGVQRSLIGQTVLIAAALIHLALGVYKFLERRTLRISIPELIQLAFGLLIPLLLMRHVLGTRGAHEFFGVDDNYYYALWAMWPDEGLWQAVLIVLAWVHACIGLFHWLRLKRWFIKARIWLVALAVLWPVLGYAGFVMQARVVQLETEFEPQLDQAQYELLAERMSLALWGYAAVLVLLVAIRIVRGFYERLRPRIEVAYSHGPKFRIPLGYSLLEVSRLHAIPHASICGGRARCSTCRVRVLRGLDEQPRPGAAEKRVLERIGAAPNVRLACQLHPTADIEFATLLPANRSWVVETAVYDKYYWGVEEKVTILFCDLRGFTKFSERRLPFDVVFMLNQYLTNMGEVIEDAGGYVDKFIGDGIMAIFGIGRDPAEGARQSLAAAKAMGGVLEALNQSLRNDLSEPLNIGIGLDTGPVILGRIGMAEGDAGSRHITALGDIVNSASRIESACKEVGVQLLVSHRTIDTAGIMPAGAAVHELSVKGKSDKVPVVAVKRAIDVPQAWLAATKETV